MFNFFRKKHQKGNPTLPFNDSYPERYAPIYELCNVTAFLCHCISFLLATHFGAVFLQAFSESAFGLPIGVNFAHILAAMIFGIIEWIQYTYIDTIIKIKFFNGRLERGMFLMCIVLTAFSTYSSSYYIPHLFPERSLLISIAIGLILINELGIIATAYWRNLYEFKADQELIENTLVQELIKNN